MIRPLRQSHARKLTFAFVFMGSNSGKVRDKFPLEMAEIQGAVVAADINDDGKIELVTTDTHGNIAAWTSQGKEIWEQHLKSLVPQVRFGIMSQD